MAPFQDVEGVHALLDRFDLKDKIIPRSIDFIVSIYGFPFWFASAGEVGQHLAQQFVTRALNLLKPGGGLLILGSAPGWRAGELSRVIWPQRVKPEGATRDNQLMTESLGF